MGTATPTTKLHLSESNAGDYASVVLLSNSADAAADRTGIYGSAPVGNALPYRGGVTFWPGASGAVSIHTGNNATPGAGQAMYFDGNSPRDVTVSTGNLIFGTAGKGIDFTQDPNPAGMTSELLDDYEEGTWTPVDASGAGLVFTDTDSKYTKIGRCVVCTFQVRFPVTVDASNNIIGGLPFSVSATLGAVNFGYTTFSATVPIYGLPGPTGNPLFAFYSGAGAPLQNSALSTAYFNGTIVYFV
jgi:hypothetical protein